MRANEREFVVTRIVKAMRLEHPLDEDRGPFLERGGADALAFQVLDPRYRLQPNHRQRRLVRIGGDQPQAAALRRIADHAFGGDHADLRRTIEREVVTLSVAPVILMSDVMP